MQKEAESSARARQLAEQVRSRLIAKQQVEQMRFRMKEALAQRGGADAFLHWLRMEDKESR
jgi:hypothetical protein